MLLTPQHLSHCCLLSLFLLARAQRKKWKNSLIWKLCCLLLCWRAVSISSQFLDISCRFHMRARQTSAVYVPLSLLFNEIPLGFLLGYVSSNSIFKKISSGIFLCKVLHNPWVKKRNKSTWVTNFNIYAAASLRSLCQRTLLTQDEVPGLMILKLWWLDDMERIKEKETKPV